MICTFVVSLLLISSVSIAFFFVFLDTTLKMSVESIFYAHTHSIVGDIIQVKKNDFMLSQNELKISKIMIMDLAQNINFNKRSLGGPSLPSSVDLTRFKKYCYSLYDYIDKDIELEDAKVMWYLKPFKFNMVDFEDAVKRRLQDKPINPNYKEMTQQQIDDIITCAASIYIRGEYSMNFKYTDLSKVKNYIGFESGIICFYPPYKTFNIGGQEFKDKAYDKAKNDFFAKNYPDEAKLYNNGCPPNYDPRCRGWYQAQYKKDHATFTDVYTYSNGDLGISNCVPLWGIDHRVRGNEAKYYGAYCYDQYPTSENSNFVR